MRSSLSYSSQADVVAHFVGLRGAVGGVVEDDESVKPLPPRPCRHHSHKPRTATTRTHTHTQPCVEVGPLRRTNAATEQPAIRKNRTLKKSATSIRSVHHKRGNRPPFLPHSVPTTTFSRSVRYYCPRVPQSRLYKHSQCSGCSLHQASKKAGLKKKKEASHLCTGRTYREKRENRPR